MEISTQSVSDVFGRFYVLCEQTWTFIGRISSQASRYGCIGDIDSGWTPGHPDRLLIKEFLGEPDHEANGKIFYDLNMATDRARDIVGEITRMYDRLREAGHAEKLALPAEGPQIPIDVELLPEKIPMADPLPFKKDAHLWIIYTNVLEQGLRIHEASVNKSRLVARFTGLALSLSDYQMEVELFAPTGDDDNSFHFLNRTFSRGLTGTWAYAAAGREDRSSVRGGFRIFESRDAAVKGAAKMAEDLQKAIVPYLPSP